MKIKQASITLGSAMLLGIVFTTSHSSFGQDFPAPKPTDEHKILEHDAGNWDATVKMYLAGPDGPPTECKGVEKGEMVCDGLCLKTEFRFKIGDRQFEGHGLIGYDPKSGDYVGTWADNFSATPTSYLAKYDAEKKTMTAIIKAPGPDGEEFTMRQVTTFIDANTKKLEQYLLLDDAGTEMKLMEIDSKKRG